MTNIVFVPCQQWLSGQQVIIAPIDMRMFAQCSTNTQQTFAPQMCGSVGEQASSSASVNSLPDSVSGNVWELSRTVEGCRCVQQALEDANSDGVRADIANELMGRVWLAIRCPNAHHVIQKCISTMRPAATQFIIDEITAKGPNGVRRIAKDRYGCRVVQRLLEHCRDDQVEILIESLLSETSALSRHIYGNFVMQHILEHGTESQRKYVMASLQADIVSVAADIHGSAVVGAALSLDAGEDLIALVRSVLNETGLLVTMASIRHGQTAVKRLLEVAEGVDMVAACQQLSADFDKLSQTRYGRGVIGCVKKCVL